MLKDENSRFLFPPTKYVGSDIDLNLLRCFDNILHGFYMADKVLRNMNR